jgi:hypothetical protein
VSPILLEQYVGVTDAKVVKRIDRQTGDEPSLVSLSSTAFDVGPLFFEQLADLLVEPIPEYRLKAGTAIANERVPENPERMEDRSIGVVEFHCRSLS